MLWEDPLFSALGSENLSDVVYSTSKVYFVQRFSCVMGPDRTLQRYNMHADEREKNGHHAIVNAPGATFRNSIPQLVSGTSILYQFFPYVLTLNQISQLWVGVLCLSQRG